MPGFIWFYGQRRGRYTAEDDRLSLLPTMEEQDEFLDAMCTTASHQDVENPYKRQVKEETNG